MKVARHCINNSSPTAEQWRKMHEEAENRVFNRRDPDELDYELMMKYAPEEMNEEVQHVNTIPALKRTYEQSQLIKIYQKQQGVCWWEKQIQQIIKTLKPEQVVLLQQRLITEQSNLAHELGLYVLQCIGKDQQLLYHVSNSLRDVMNNWIKDQIQRNLFEQDEAMRAESFLRFCIRTIERIQLNEEIHSSRSLRLKCKQLLRSEWSFEVIQNNINSILKYNEETMHWDTIHGEMIDIDWTYYLHQELLIQKHSTQYRYYREPELISFEVTRRAMRFKVLEKKRLQNIKCVYNEDGILQVTGCRPDCEWYYCDLFYNEHAQMKEKTLDTFGESQFYNNLPVAVRKMIELFI